MAVLAMEKVQILGIKKDLNKVLQLLQKKGVMEIRDFSETTEDEVILNAIEKEDHDTDYIIANTDFAIKALTPYAPKRPIWAGKITLTPESALGTIKNFDYRKTIKEVQSTEEKHVAAQNKLHALATEEKLLLNWENLRFNLDTERHTRNVRILTGEIAATEYEAFTKSLNALSSLTNCEKINEVQTTTYVVVVIGNEFMEEGKQLLAKHKFQEVELSSHPMSAKERLKAIALERSEYQSKITDQEAEYKELAKSTENLQIVHDVFTWQQEEQRVREKLKGTTYSFVVTGWIAKQERASLETELAEISENIHIHTIKPDNDEDTPIQLLNKKAAWPFESVTKLYGFPLINEVDPTPLLATFFIIFFALCLTDAGYGLTLFIIMFVILRFFNLPKESTGLIKLLMWGGLLTIISGYFFGGYFGLTIDQAPSFMVENGAFKGQIINATAGNGPLTFLILAFVLGIIQVLFGKLIDGIWKIKQKQYIDALLDSFLWIYFLLAIIAFGLASTGILISDDYASLTKWLVLGGVAAMILTQGRKYKGIAGKLGIGILSLYGLVGYLGDILSYSRIMALGLSTGIIAFAMNTIAGLAYELIPYVGFIFAIIVLILGHTMNLVLSALGAFIHSARLQFVEFFSKFMEGGGKDFKPFTRQCKYILIQ